MRLLLLLLGAGVGLVVAFVVWRLIASIRGSHRRTERILQEISPVMEALRDGRDPSNQDLVRFASHPRTRNTLFLVLQEHGKKGLFPQEYLTAEAVAEGDLVFWLCHPNELQSAPDEIELIGKFPKDLGPPVGRVEYYLFRFRARPPHWAADDGWMAGVAGPYREGHTPQPVAPGTFSDFAAFESRPAEGHVDAIHDIMMQKGAYEGLGTDPGGDDGRDG